MSNHREEILSRVREALRQPTDAHVRHTGPPASQAEPQAWLPPGGEDHETRAERFGQLSDKLRTDFRRVPNLDVAATELQQIAERENWQCIARHANPLVESACSGLQLDCLTTDEGYDPDALEACDVGITACDALIAQTGSVLLTTRSGGGRALSVLPPHHVVIATADQLLPDLPTAYGLLYDRYGEQWPSFMTFITGPSRTGDIERILVLGAHGPKKLTVILVEE